MRNISANIGQMAIGGDFRLIDQTGMEVKLQDFKGKWVILYFGFCRCPDICPEQIERLVEVRDRLGMQNIFFIIHKCNYFYPISKAELTTYANSHFLICFSIQRKAPLYAH